MLAYTSRMTYKKFMEDLKTQDAVARNFEIMGEAVKRISPALKAKYPDVPWRYIAQFRDRLIHHYSGVNFDIVWDIIKESLPVFEKQIKLIIQEFR